MVIGKTDLRETSWEDIMKMGSNSIVKWIWEYLFVSVSNTLKSRRKQKKMKHILPVLEFPFAVLRFINPHIGHFNYETE